MNKTNIILTGFMGSGKTTVGKLLANRLGYRFVDTDLMIEERCGKTVENIFATLGETFFRRMEAELASELGGKKEMVIATGGKLMLDEENVQALSRCGHVFCLFASAEKTLQRVQADPAARPLLNVADLRAQIERLILERKQGYSRFMQLDTTDKSPAEIVGELMDIIRDKE